MRTTIFKYRVLDNQSAINNYFDRSSDLIYVDKFITDRHLINGFPVFREEWAQEDNINNIKTGFFDLKLSMIMSERSEVFSRTLLEFFENLDNNIKKYKYIVVCETGNADRSYSGIVDLNSLRTEESVIANQFYIYCSVTGIEAEFAALMQSSRITKIPSDQVFDSTYIQTMLYWADPSKLLIQSQLNLHERLGYDLTIDKSLLDNVWNANLDITGTFCIISNWDAFRSFILGYQIKFKIIFRQNTPSGPAFRIVLFFRTDGINQTSGLKILTPGRALVSGGADWISIFYTHRPDGTNPKLEHFSGIITSSRTQIYISDDIIYNNEERYYQIGSIQILEDQIQKIDLTHYSTTLIAGDVAICKLVPGHTLNPLLLYLGNFEIPYYLKALKKKRNYKLKVDQGSNLSLGSKAVIDSTSYTCDRINSFDNYNETMEAEFVEV